MKKRILGKWIRMPIVLVISILFDLFVCNAAYFSFLCNADYEKNIVYEMDEFSTLGWESKDEGLISTFDPILYLMNLNKNIRNVRIEVETKQEIPYVEIFYSNNEKPEINTDLYIKEETPFLQSIEIEINEYVKDIRFDLSDMEGLYLENVRVVFNYNILEISMARIVAINLIYWAYVFLFHLQETPKYNIE